MIKFFSKIRQNMIKENRVSNYFLYAIGEIVLVVIGILIALQINNWNEDRKNKTIANNYLVRINKELLSDAALFESLSQEFKDKSEKLKRILANFNSDALLFKNSKEFKDDFFDINGISPWYKDPIAWTQLVQSAELKLIKNQELIDALMRHYAEVKNSADDYSKFPVEIMIESRKLLSAAIANDNNPELDSGDKLNAGTFQYILSNKQSFKELIVRIRIISRNYSYSTRQHAKSATALAKLIESVIDNELSND